MHHSIGKNIEDAIEVNNDHVMKPIDEQTSACKMAGNWPEYLLMSFQIILIESV